MRNYYFGLLICLEVVILTAVNGYNSDIIIAPDNNEIYQLPELVILHKSCKFNPEKEILVHLKKNLDSVLANKNLPIWLVHSNSDLQNVSYDVMEDIGPFFMYHDLDSCSAAVYFYKRQQFDGTVDNRYIINRVPYDVETKKAKPSKYNMIKTHTLKHPETRLKGSLSSDSSELLVIQEEKAQKIEKQKWINIQSNLEYPNNVYIETLVIVNYDLVNIFEKNYTSLVSNILVTFNTVDLLYAKIDKPKIKINIAGIMIGVERESFSDLLKQKCYDSSHLSDDEEQMEVKCIASAVKSILFKYKKAFPLNSYDIAVFLTNYNLYSYSLNTDGNIETLPLDGVAFTPEHHEYSGYKMTLDDSRIVVATYFNDAYQSFPVIAHEMAHLFNVLHDQGELRNSMGECNANIMRTDGTFCTKCLLFSDNSAKKLREFFGTREGCIFFNEPKSLYYPLQPQLSMNDEEQCKCYGFMSARKFHQNWWDQLKGTFKSNVYCRTRLHCVSSLVYGDPKFTVKTAVPMDGTPCDSNKVCWNKKCKEIAN
ncbi:hypothetical protein PV327_010661 [Microctonus hyperodae]|uniref:Peptidase M12B domain-containing protein n=1 Tax=Microctonus hyperodae TaxID=165561 RepID=A0AA39C7Y1_MICHY|nr:hypothetical protein PV327_010661 [Microctonus hyperodae]